MFWANREPLVKKMSVLYKVLPKLGDGSFCDLGVVELSVRKHNLKMATENDQKEIQPTTR